MTLDKKIAQAILSSTISNKVIHLILITLEYFLSIFPFVISAKYNIYSKNDFEIRRFHLLSKFKDKLNKNPEKNDFDRFLLSNFSLIGAGLSLIFLIIYYILSFCSKEMKKLKGILLNFYNIIFFRYFSFFFIDLIFYPIVYQFINEDSYVNKIIFFVFLFIFVLFVFTDYRFISNHSIHINISNKNFVTNPLDYPFDSFSESYDKEMLFYKIMCSFISNLQDKFEVVGFFLNCLILFLGIFIMVKDNLFCFFRRKRINYLTNFELNFLRKIIIFFNFSLCLSSLFLHKTKDFSFEIYNISVCLSLSVTFTFAKWLIYERPSIVNNQIFSAEIISFLLSKNLESFDDQIESEMVANLKINFYLKDNQFSKKEKTISNFDMVYKVYKYQKDKIYMNSSEDFLILFFHSIEKKNFYKTYKYIQLIENSKFSSSIQNVAYLIDNQNRDSFSNESKSLNLFLKFIRLCELNKKITSNLNEFQKLSTNEILLQSTEQFIDCSKKLLSIKRELFSIIKENEAYSNIISKSSEKVKEKFQEENKKIARANFLYNLTLSRYIVETMINEPLDKLSHFNIENYDEYLTLNFYNLSFIILSIDLTNIHFPSFDIVSISGIRKDKEKTLNDYFPKKYQREGTQKLLKELINYHSNSIGKFEYILDINGYIEHFLLRFELCDTLVSEGVILYGNYKSVNNKIISLDKRNKNFNVLSFSKEFSKLIIFKPKILRKISFHNNFCCNINHLFQKVHISSDNTVINCELNYHHLLQLFLVLFEISRKNKVLSQDIEFINSMTRLKSFFYEKEKKVLLVKLTKILSLDHSTDVYSVEESSIKSEDYFLPYSGKSNVSQKEKSYIYESENNAYLNNLKGIGTSSISTEKAKSDEVASIKNSKSKKNDIEIKAVKKEARFLTLTSSLFFFLNIAIIFLCIIFLCIQIIETNELTEINTLFFDFKSLRLSFNNVFYSTISLVCIEETGRGTHNNKCDNKFIKFFRQYQESINFNDYDIADYLWFEVSNKVNNLKRLYSNFKRKLHAKKKYKRFIPLFSSDVTFYQLEQGNNEIIQHKFITEFDTASQVIINNEIELTSVELSESFAWTSYPILTASNGDYKFNEIHYFSQNQQIIFRIIANFVNFGVSYTNGESMIFQNFKEVKNENLYVSVSFMIIFVLLNLFLFFINYFNIKVSYIAFKKLFTTFVFKLNEPEFKVFFNSKLKNLELLSKLYKINPSSMIDLIIKEEFNHSKEILKSKRKNAEKNTTHIKLEKEKILKNEYFLSLSNDTYQMNNFYRNTLNPFSIKNYVLFFVYYTIILILDIILIIEITSVYKARDYAESSINVQLLTYSSLSLVHLSHVINTTEENLANALKVNVEKDGLTNIYIRRTLAAYNKMLEMERNDGYPTQTSYYPNNCREVYKAANDSFLVNFQKIIGNFDEKTFFKLQEKFCQDFNLDSHPYFAYEDFIHRLQIIHNKFFERDFKGIIGIFNKEFYTLYLYVYFYIRPIKKNYDNNIVIPRIIEKFNSYVVYVWIYLIINLLLETSVFLITRFLITKELRKVKELFFLFAKCIKD